jgi:hypothetical protein
MYVKCVCVCVCLNCVYVNHKRNWSYPALLCLEIMDSVFRGNMAFGLLLCVCSFWCSVSGDGVCAGGDSPSTSELWADMANSVSLHPPVRTVLCQMVLRLRGHTVGHARSRTSR